MTPREKIAAIFAKARSTTSPHERDNAVTLGTRLAEKAGLSLDLFDVPGRVRAKPEPEVRGRRGSEMGGASYWSDAGPENLAEALRRYRDQESRAREAAARAKPHPLYPHAENAAAFLRSVGCKVQAQPGEPGKPRLWSLINAGRIFAGISDEDLIAGAVAVTPAHVRAEHEERERQRMATDAMWRTVWF